jgi:amphi-Trp domain-containing protein
MSKSVYKDKRQLTRPELAAELRRVASEVESSAHISFGDGEESQQVAVSDTLKREIDVERAKDGSRMNIQIELAWRPEDAPTSVEQSGDG